MPNRSVTVIMTATAVYLVLLSVVTGFPDEGNAAVGTGAGGLRAAAAVAGHGGGENDVEAEWNEVDEGGAGRLDLCARNPEAAETCAACPGLLPESGVTAWRCCVDPAVHEVCSGAEAVISRTLTADVDDETGDAIDKRAKYFLGKRAKYFLGKRAFGARRTGAHRGVAFRAGSRQQMMSEGLEAAEKRAKYFLGK